MITSLSIGQGGLGRFGNQLFTVAGVIGIARRSGQPFAFPHWKNFDNASFGGEVTNFETVFANPLPRLPEGLQFTEYPYFWEYRDICLPSGNWNINAHLQSVKYFQHCIDEIRYYFTFKEEYPQNDYVAVHYRAGDYIDNPGAYHPRCSKEYYERALSMFPEGIKFLVFSDNMDEARKVFDLIPGFCIYNFELNYIESFKFMKSCKSFITANSSFSHMAALLGTNPEKKIVMPKKWFGKQADGLSFDSLYPPEAIVI